MAGPGFLSFRTEDNLGQTAVGVAGAERAVLCTVGWLALSLASTHHMSVAPSLLQLWEQSVSRHCPASPGGQSPQLRSRDVQGRGEGTPWTAPKCEDGEERGAGGKRR